MNDSSARSTPANRLRFIGSGVLVLGLTAAYLFYRVRSQSLGPTMDDLLPGYSERRARQTGIIMGGLVVELLQDAEKLKEPFTQAVIIAVVSVLAALMLLSRRVADGPSDRRPENARPRTICRSTVDLRQMFVLANAFKEGDLLVGGTDDVRVREDARRTVESLTLGAITSSAFVDDGVSDALERSLEPRTLADLSGLTVAALKQILLSAAGPDWVARHRRGLRSEAIAAVAKVMSDDELSRVARRLFNPLPGDGTTIGSAGHFGSRIQPNSPGDDEDEILISILEGLTYGCGDVIIGLNPASDDVDTIVNLEDLLRRVVDRLQLPTRYCVLSDIVKQTRARERTPVDVGFQSLAGTSKALAGMVGLDADGILDLSRGFGGCYFETGQGSAVTNGAADGVDMVTLEARAYGVARHIQQTTGAWTIVNDVAGFIGPEVFRTAAQLQRACLEDIVMAKLHGLTMGLDVCATFHMGIAPAELKQTTQRIVETAAPAYLMAVAGNADPMLGYLTTSFREHPQLRRQSQRRIATAMEQRLAALGASSTAALYAAYHKAGGDRRTVDALQQEGTLKVARLRERGFDLGRDDDGGVRIDAIYAQARRALYAVLDGSVMQDASPQHVMVRTYRARSRRLSRASRIRRVGSQGRCRARVLAGRIDGIRPAGPGRDL